MGWLGRQTDRQRIVVNGVWLESVHPRGHGGKNAVSIDGVWYTGWLGRQTDRQAVVVNGVSLESVHPRDHDGKNAVSIGCFS